MNKKAIFFEGGLPFIAVFILAVFHMGLDNGWLPTFQYSNFWFSGMLIASLALGFKKCSITNEGVTKKIYVLPFLKKIKTWREIKHLAHVIFVTENKRKKEKSCTNLLGFIDHNDKILLTIEDRTKKSYFSEEDGSLVTKEIQPDRSFKQFMGHIKRREDQFETNLIVTDFKVMLGWKRVLYQTAEESKL